MPGVGTLDDAARAAGMIVQLFAQSFLVSIEDRLATDIGSAVEATSGEVIRGQSACFIHDVNQDGRSVRIQTAFGFGDVMRAQGLSELLSAFVEECLILDLLPGGALAIDDNIFEPLAAHDSTEAATTGIASGAV